MPRSLHRKLAEAAEQEGVSLNQYVVYLLSEENTSRQHYSVIFKLLSEKLKTMKIQGIKQGNAITLPEELANLPDGTEVTIEITVDQNLSPEDLKKKLDELFGVWKDDPQTDEFSTKIHKERLR
jgi:antitoxin component of MazEF toxin-antitoxin module